MGETVENYKEAVEELFSEKERVLILGLTGRTGSGCSTAASILGKKFENLDLEYKKEDNTDSADEVKFEIIKNYISESDRWKPFDVIQGSCVILSFVFEQQYSDMSKSNPLIDYLSELQKDNMGKVFKINDYEKLVEELKGIAYIFENVQKLSLSSKNKPWSTYSDEEIKQYYNLYMKEISVYKDRIKKILNCYTCYEEKKSKLQDEPPVKYHLYTYLLQKLGNNVRASGNPFDEGFVQTKYNSLAQRMVDIIELIIAYNNRIKQADKTRICIDAIRNPNESNYLKDKYRSYYLMSISVDEATRIKRLGSFDNEEINGVDNIEYLSKLKPNELFYHQNIANCFEMADIHLLNPDESTEKRFFLTRQLVKYITLMIHPGLITPTHLESCMQLAYTAKLNSGCLSRQVGAVVTGNDFSIKAIGWNDVPKGQTSCNLRDLSDYCRGNCQDPYSEYEVTNKQFQKAANVIKSCMEEKQLGGRKIPYCFKDIYNGYTNEKNQVYTRSLHAEENAFLQVSKYGGQGVQDGYLFVTASPCELCSKKSYQLGIRNIYYIDPYPGIAKMHIINNGVRDKRPRLNLFYGAIGEAYMSLYKPLLSYKDELELVSGVSHKSVAAKGKSSADNATDIRDLFYNSVEFSIEFKTRESIKGTRTVDITVKNGKYTELERSLTWTGSSYDGSELIGIDGDYELEDTKDECSPYKYIIKLNDKKEKDSSIKYTIVSNVKDETHLMHPYLAHMVKNPTKKLILRVICDATNSIIDNVQYKRYADFKMNYEYPEEKEVTENQLPEGKKEYVLEIDNPNLFYCYSIEWDFINIKS